MEWWGLRVEIVDIRFCANLGQVVCHVGAGHRRPSRERALLHTYNTGCDCHCAPRVFGFNSV